MDAEFHARLLTLFERVFHRPLTPALITSDLEEWDSMSHFTLVAALEQEFGVWVSDDDIAHLFSNFETIAKFIKKSKSDQ